MNKISNFPNFTIITQEKNIFSPNEIINNIYPHNNYGKIEYQYTSNLRSDGIGITRPILITNDQIIYCNPSDISSINKNESFSNGNITNGYYSQNNINKKYSINDFPLSTYVDSSGKKRNIIKSTTIEEMFSEMAINQNGKNACEYFLKGNCRNNNCNKIHGYGGYLINISITDIHNYPITNLVKINENQFISTDSQTMKIYKISDKLECIQSKSIYGGGYIDKVYYINETIFISKNFEVSYTQPPISVIVGYVSV